MNKLFVRLATLTFCLGFTSLWSAQAQQIFNVKSFGATGNGSTLDSPAVNSAIAAAGAAGGGIVTFPSGTYLCGSIHLTNNLTLYLSNGAVIIASASHIDTHESSSFSQYQDEGHSYFHDALIWGENLTGLTFEGPGKIDGHGALTTGNPSSSNPGDKALCLVLSTNIVIAGVTITNGGHFGILAQACSDMIVTNVNIEEKTSRDGFNLISCSFVTISNCLIEGSDDAMCPKSTYALGRKIDSAHVHISHCTILSTQNNATQFGSETVGNFSDYTFSDLTLTGAGKAGIGITSQDGSIIDGVTYDNITMNNCATPIFLKLDHRTTDAPSPVPLGMIRNISIRNVTATHSTLDGRVGTSTINGYFDGSSVRTPIHDITFENVNVSNVGGQPASANNNVPNNNQDWQPQNFGSWPSYGWYLRYAENISFTNCQTHFDANDDRAAVAVVDTTNVLFDGLTAQVGSSSPYDFHITSAFYDIINAVSTTGSTLRINASGSSAVSILEPPQFNPGDGNYGSPLSVSLSAPSGASINYTTDGSTPSSTSGTSYAGPFDLSSDTVVKAIAFGGGPLDSAVSTADYRISGSSGGQNFSMSASPGSQTVAPGGSASYTITVTPVNGFNGTVTFSASGQPSGSSVTFNPPSVTGSGTSTMTVNTSSSTPAGTYTVTATGTSGSLVQSTSVSLTVTTAPDFSVSTTPSSQTVQAGNSTSYTVNLGNINGFTGTISLGSSGLPSGASASFNPSSSTAPGSSTMTVDTSTSTPAGSSTVTITGTSGSLSHSTNVTLTVTGGSLPSGWTDADIGPVGMTGSASFSGGTFTVSGSGADIFGTADEFNYAYQSVSGDQTIIARVVSENGNQSYSKAGVMIRESTASNAVSATVLITPTNGVAMEVRSTTGASTVNITGWIKNVLPPQWVKVVRSGNTFTGSYSADGSTWTQIASTNITMNSSATAGLAVTDHSNTGLNTANFDNVSITGATPDFSLSASPSSLTITQANNGTSTITVNPINGYANTVSFSASGLPSGVTASFNPSSSTTGSTLTLTASSTAALGTVTVTITGTDGTLTHTTTLTLTVNPAVVPDFSLSASPSSLTIVQGNNGTSTITVSPINGYNNTVSLSASGLPTGVTASFNPTSTTTSSTLTLTVSSNAATGPATVTVTGTDGTLTHTTPISLTVNPANTNNFAGTFQIQNEASLLVLNNQGALTNGSPITQWTIASSSNLDWTFIATSNGYYQINSSKSGLDAVVMSASTTNGAKIVQWAFGSSGDDQWQPVQNGDGSYTFFNLHSGLVLGDPGSSTNKTTQMDQETSNGGSNQKWQLLKQ